MTAELTGRSRVLCVWGHPVAHSRSPRMHNAALAAMGLDWAYVPFDVAPDDVPAAVAGVRALGIVGVNVTVPLKETIAAHLDVVDPSAERAGSVNTIHLKDSLLYGYSTDGPGLVADWKALGWPTENQSIYLLGAGGSARAIACSLAERGNRITVANRSRERSEGLVRLLNQWWPGSAVLAGLGERPADIPGIVVNSTTIGMHPHVDDAPLLPSGLLDTRPRVYDLIYAPEETTFLSRARAAGCAAANGLGMLVWQGALSLSIWTGARLEELPVEAMDQAARSA